STYGQLFLVGCEDIQTIAGNFQNTNVGTSIVYSLNCSISGLSLDGCHTGIDILSSPDCTIVYADIVYAGPYASSSGIFSEYSPRLNISNCNFENVANGIEIEYCPDSFIVWNTMNDTYSIGIDLRDSPRSVVAYNEFEFAPQVAIDIIWSDGVAIHNNTMIHEVGGALYIYQSDYALVADNTITCTGSGLYLSNHVGTRIEGNTIDGTTSCIDTTTSTIDPGTGDPTLAIIGIGGACGAILILVILLMRKRKGG
ncbi:MAG: right-handed parallel beta-helix repeat-containing protein, partial [Candidatus Thorarchaeota archaeon]|nr:right-handed parallel beta-helix repeat-containing protein [Candidatus Thorarchaeota archaeon]